MPLVKEITILVTCFHGKRLELQKNRRQRMIREFCQFVELVMARCFLIGQDDPAFQQFFNGLLCGETPVFCGKPLIQAELQSASMALHNPQK